MIATETFLAWATQVRALDTCAARGAVLCDGTA